MGVFIAQVSVSLVNIHQTDWRLVPPIMFTDNSSHLTSQSIKSVKWVFMYGWIVAKEWWITFLTGKIRVPFDVCTMCCLAISFDLYSTLLTNHQTSDPVFQALHQNVISWIWILRIIMLWFTVTVYISAGLTFLTTGSINISLMSWNREILPLHDT